MAKIRDPDGRICSEKEKQRTEPNVASFPLKIFVEFRSHVGQKPKRQKASEKQKVLSFCHLVVLRKQRLEFSIF